MSWTIKKQARVELVLTTIDKLGFMSRSQIQAITSIQSRRNALKVIADMKEYLNVKRHVERYGENVYYLNQKGRDYIGSVKERQYNQTVEHTLLRNDLYLHFNQPHDFLIEPEVEFRSGLQTKFVKPDAHFTIEGQDYFVEVDRTQNMLENKKKISYYSQLSPIMEAARSKPPILIFFTLTNTRKKLISAVCQEHNVKFQILSREEVI